MSVFSHNPDVRIIHPKAPTIDEIAMSQVIGLEAEIDLLAPKASPTFTGTVSGISKTMVGLGNVDNTSDADKPVSTAQATAIGKAVNYSTTEALTGGTWIDGKVIYRKVINYGAMPNNSSKTVAHGISNLQRMIDISAIMGTSSAWRLLPYSPPDSLANSVQISSDGGNVWTQTGSSAWTTYSAYIILEYTKTT